MHIPSLPAWERGLKLLFTSCHVRHSVVAPCVGAWIETSVHSSYSANKSVAPCVGAWIETASLLPSSHRFLVAPCVGAWIETL